VLGQRKARLIVQQQLQQEYHNIGDQQVARDGWQVNWHQVVSGKSVASVATAA
jgi:hypothetical protein